MDQKQCNGTLVATQTHNLKTRNTALPDTATPESTKLTDNQITIMPAPQMNEMQILLRDDSDQQSQSKNRTSHLPDLPAEVLYNIFTYLRAPLCCSMSHPDAVFSNEDEDCKEISDIQSVRLCCRQFCGLSSSLLIRYVRAELSTTSLSRLESILAHPILRKGVRGIYLDLRFYNSSLVEDVTAFENFFTRRVHLWQNHLSEIKRAVQSSDTRHYAYSSNLLTQWKSVLEHPMALATIQQGVQCHEAHEFYIMNHREQLQMMQEFTTRLCAALSRCSSMHHFFFLDQPEDSLELNNFCANVKTGGKQSLLSMLIHPCSQPSSLEGSSQRYLHSLKVRLPTLLHNVGVIPLSINLGALNVWLYKENRLGMPEILRIATALRRLRRISFHIEVSSPELRAAEGGTQIAEFIHATMDTPSLQEIDISLTGLSDDGVPVPSYSQLNLIIKGRRYPELKMLRLTGVTFRSEEIKTLVSISSTPSLEELELEYADLLDGSWRDVLDAFRERTLQVINIFEISGMDVDSLGEAEYDRIFTLQGDDLTSLAELFVLGVDMPNPLNVEAEDEEE